MVRADIDLIRSVGALKQYPSTRAIILTRTFQVGAAKPIIHYIHTTTWRSEPAARPESRRKGLTSGAAPAENRSAWRCEWSCKVCSALSLPVTLSTLTSPSLKLLVMSGTSWAVAGAIPRSSPMSPNSACNRENTKTEQNKDSAQPDKEHTNWRATALVCHQIQASSSTSWEKQKAYGGDSTVLFEQFF